MGQHEAEPQSCYPDEIKTLRAMLREERKRLEACNNTLDVLVSEDRIEALRTAIEALGGAL